jgi:geranylgeranyl pyrophosphate synthase
VRLILERVGAQEYTRSMARHHRDEALATIASVAMVDRDAIQRLSQVVQASITA